MHINSPAKKTKRQLSTYQIYYCCIYKYAVSSVQNSCE
jgi:hypothetical protein